MYRDKRNRVYKSLKDQTNDVRIIGNMIRSLEDVSENHKYSNRDPRICKHEITEDVCIVL